MNTSMYAFTFDNSGKTDPCSFHFMGRVLSEAPECKDTEALKD